MTGRESVALLLVRGGEQTGEVAFYVTLIESMGKVLGWPTVNLWPWWCVALPMIAAFAMNVLVLPVAVIVWPHPGVPWEREPRKRLRLLERLREQSREDAYRGRG